MAQEAFTDRDILREQAALGMFDPFYLSTELLQLQDDQPRTTGELKPIYDYFNQPRPESLPKGAKWLRFWSSPRFTAKTYIGLVYCLSKILRDRNIAIIIICQEKQMAVDSVKLLREWLLSPKIVQLYGTFKSDDFGKEEFTIIQRNRSRRDPTVRALGLDVPMQGKRCDFIWPDDLIGEGNNSDEGILKVESRISAAMPLLRPGGEMLYTCTRWNAFDPSTDGYTISGQPGILRLWKQHNAWHCPPTRGFFGAYAKPGDEHVFPGAVPGKPLFPGVLSEDNIKQARQTMNRAEFNSQILNDPLPDDTRYFSSENIQYFSAFDDDGALHPQLVGAIPFMAVDPASGKQGKKGMVRDETTFCLGYVKWERDSPMGFVVEWTGGIWKPDKTMDVFFDLLQRFKPRKIFIETNIGGEYFVDPIRKRARELGMHFLPIEEVHSSLKGTGKKDARIGAMQEVYSYRRIWHDQKLKLCKGEDQMLRWAPHSAGHDDWIDVLAMWYLLATKKRFEPRDPRGRDVRRMSMLGRKRKPQYPSTGM